jgi:hypothetical protein
MLDSTLLYLCPTEPNHGAHTHPPASCSSTSRRTSMLTPVTPAVPTISASKVARATNVAKKVSCGAERERVRNENQLGMYA